VLSFGLSGKLRHSDMVMYDRQTESWWQQTVGVGIVGEMTGVALRALPTWMESWADFKSCNPDGLVMDQPAGFQRDYGHNPYRGYDTSDWPFRYKGKMPHHGISPLVWVVRVGDRAWPLTRVAVLGALSGAGVVISWTARQALALDTSRIASGRDVRIALCRHRCPRKCETVLHDGSLKE